MMENKESIVLGTNIVYNLINGISGRTSDLILYSLLGLRKGLS